MILLEYQNIKNFSAKDYVPNWSEGALVIKKVKNNVPWTYVITDFNGEVIAATSYKKELQKTNQKEFRVEKVIKKPINYMLNGKAMIIILTVALRKKT